jgi:hypothetical protein
VAVLISELPERDVLRVELVPVTVAGGDPAHFLAVGEPGRRLGTYLTVAS